MIDGCSMELGVATLSVVSSGEAPHTQDRARTFEFVLHFVGCDTVTVSPNQIIIIYYYY